MQIRAETFSATALAAALAFAALVLVDDAAAGDKAATRPVAVANEIAAIDAAGLARARIVPILVPRPVPQPVPPGRAGGSATTDVVAGACEGEDCRERVAEGGDGSVFLGYPLYFVEGAGIRLPDDML